MSEKYDFKKSLQVSIANCLVRRVQCCCFSKFYSKGEVPPRCLLEEYKDENNQTFFNEEESLQICQYRNPKLKSKCEYPENPQARNKRLQELESENKRLKNENWKLRTELKETVLELKSLSTS